MRVSAVSGRGDVDRKMQQAMTEQGNGEENGYLILLPGRGLPPTIILVPCLPGTTLARVSRPYPTGMIVDEETQQTATPQMMMISPDEVI